MVIEADEVPSRSKVVPQQLTVHVSVYAVQKTQGTFRPCILGGSRCNYPLPCPATVRETAMRSVMSTTRRRVTLTFMGEGSSVCKNDLGVRKLR